MAKIMFSLWRPKPQSAEHWRDTLIGLQDLLMALGASEIRLMVVDQDVEKASAQRMTASRSPLDGMLSITLEDPEKLRLVLRLLEKHVEKLHAYQVRESVPCSEKRSARKAQLGIQNAIGKRTPGMCQVATFKRPPRLSLDEWTHHWREHGFSAYILQSIFDCRQNIVIAALTPGAPEIDAIVEEHYPATAIGNPAAFYGAPGNFELLYEREQATSESVCRFMDFGSLDCILTSFYQVSA
ncbi:hypothetical protein [Comamonas fluminis]|uniref:hypothetical protein n=1 Tax=Comamonas fluminis TaxID=2796366 RepID=UPI001C4752C1|nr:hypothetical protein [Comamonas fluminis]